MASSTRGRVPHCPEPKSHHRIIQTRMSHRSLDLLSPSVLLSPSSIRDFFPTTSTFLVILPDELVSLSETSDDRWHGSERSSCGRVVGERG
jgi:hypothetical protein